MQSGSIRPRRLATLPLIAVLLAVLLILAAVGTLLFTDRWRHDPDPPSRVDALIVLAGDPSRPRHAAELYRQGYAPVAYLCRPAERSIPPEEEVNRDILLQGGVPPEAIRVYAEGAENTLAEAQISLAELPASVKTVLLVTSPRHVRRARMIFSDVLGARGIRVTVAATPDQAYPDPWWSDKASARQSARELIKAVLYTAGIRYSD